VPEGAGAEAEHAEPSAKHMGWSAEAATSMGTRHTAAERSILSTATSSCFSGDARLQLPLQGAASGLQRGDVGPALQLLVPHRLDEVLAVPEHAVAEGLAGRVAGPAG